MPEGESLTVQPIGTPGLLLVKNLAFEAPGFETGMPSDFTTELAVFRDGQEIARKTIRVNDPLAVGGYTFHQNGFGPAPHLVIRDAAGKPLWDAQVPMTDSVRGLALRDDGRAGPRLRPAAAPDPRHAGPGRRARAAVPHPRRGGRRHPDRGEPDGRDPASRRHPRLGRARASPSSSPTSASTRCSSPSATRGRASSGWPSRP